MNWKIVAKYLVLKWSWIFSRIHNLYVPYYQYDIYRILIQDATRVFQKKPELLTLREDSGVLEETGTAYSSRGLGCLRRNRNCLLLARTRVSQKKPELLTPREDSGSPPMVWFVLLLSFLVCLFCFSLSMLSVCLEIVHASLSLRYGLEI